MNHSNAPVEDSAFPAFFVIISTFIGALIWMVVLVNSLPM
jgi:hypothetical protein